MYEGLVVVLLVLVIVLFAFLKISRKQIALMQKLLRLQAKKREGIVKSDNFSYYPYLSFPFQGKEIKVYSTQANKQIPSYTHIEYHLSSVRNDNLAIYQEKKEVRLAKPLGINDVQIGNEEFDNEFRIQTSEELVAYNFLSDDIQKIFFNFFNCSPEIKVQNNKFYFTVKSIPDTNAEYDVLIDSAIILISKLQQIG